MAVTSTVSARSKESTCGGCHLRNLDYNDQLSLKTKLVTVALKEFSIEAPHVADIIPSVNQLNYRNKAQFAIQRDLEGKKVVGLYELNTNIVAGKHVCEIQHPLVNKVLQQFRTFLHHHDVSIYNETTRSGSLRHLVVRVAFKTSEVMVCLVSATHSFTHLNAFTQAMRAIPQVKSILLHYNPLPGDQVIQDTTHVSAATEQLVLNSTEYDGLLTAKAQKTKMRSKIPKTVSLGGRNYILETIAGVKVKVSLNSFLQSNPLQTACLYEEVLKCVQDSRGSGTASTSPLDATKSSATTLQSTKFTATIPVTNEAVKPRVLWDLYCGVGTIGLYLANTPFISHVIGVESVQEAVLDARENAQLNNITNIHFVQGLAEEIILSNWFTPGATKATVDADNPSNQPHITLPALQRNDIVIVNPPRKGCHVSLLSALLQRQVRTIVYISCNPKTMARDLKILTTPSPTKAGSEVKKKSNAAKSELECLYEIKRIQPVDMFPQTTHVETVVWLERVTSHK